MVTRAILLKAPCLSSSVPSKVFAVAGAHMSLWLGFYVSWVKVDLFSDTPTVVMRAPKLFKFFNYLQRIKSFIYNAYLVQLMF